MNKSNLTPSGEEMNNNENANPVKPLKKLAKTNKNNSEAANIGNNRNEPADALQQNADEYRGRYEAEVPEQESEEYQGRYSAEDAYQQNESENFDEEEVYDDNAYDTEAVPDKKRSAKNILIKTGAILVSICVILLLVLNMPIIAYNKAGNPIESISIITFIKRWQPLVSGEGNLESNSMDLNINSDVVHDEFSDGLDLPQLIEGQYTVLFLGFDEDGAMSDVNWVFQFDIAGAKLNVLQIPRDTSMPDYTGSYTSKFNSIYSQGNPEKSPIQRVVDAVQENFGIPIDAYVTTNCYDIVSMVDLVGGIPITLDEEIIYEPEKIIPAGSTVLDGEKAEWFVRYRHGFAEGDIGRVKNQRKFLAAAMEKMLHIYSDEGKTKFYGYLKSIYENEYILTDLSLENISMIADFASTITLDAVQVNMVPGEGAWHYPPEHQKQSVWSVHKQATIDMLNEYYRPYQNDLLPEQSALVELVTDYLNTYNDNTGDTLDELQDGVKPGQNKTE